jgi:hypothetical protein
MIGAQGPPSGGDEEHGIQAQRVFCQSHPEPVLIVDIAQGAKAHETTGNVIGFLQIDCPQQALA